MFVFATVIGLATATVIVSTVATPQDATGQKSRGGKKRGIKPGQKLNNDKNKKEWYLVCQLYEDKYKNTMTKKAFLESDITGGKFTGSTSEQQSFGRYLRQYKDGTLKNIARKRDREVKFPQVEALLVRYIDSHDEKYKGEKCRIPWTTLTAKSLEFAKMCGVDTDKDFCASPGWIQKVLERNDKTGTNFRGAADKYAIDPNHVCNSDQSGNFKKEDDFKECYEPYENHMPPGAFEQPGSPSKKPGVLEAVRGVLTETIGENTTRRATGIKIFRENISASLTPDLIRKCTTGLDVLKNALDVNNSLFLFSPHIKKEIDDDDKQIHYCYRDMELRSEQFQNQNIEDILTCNEQTVIIEMKVLDNTKQTGDPSNVIW